VSGSPPSVAVGERTEECLDAATQRLHEHDNQRRQQEQAQEQKRHADQQPTNRRRLTSELR
jgi:hypothetical protein